MKKRDLLLTVLAVVLALTAAIGAAHAYFTTYITARGGYHLLLGKEIVFSETPTSADKTVNIQSDANSGPLYVRVKAIVAAQYADKLAYSGDNWILEDGYYYYTASVPEYDRIELRRAWSLKGLAEAQPLTVWRKHASGGYERVQVETGISDGINIEIKSGQSAVDKLRGPRVINTEEDGQ